MSKRTLSLVGIAIVLLFIGGYYGSPYWALHQMQAAGRAGEGDRLATYVDFPAVRESLKSQMQAMMVTRLQGDSMKDNPFAALGMALAGGMVNTLVEGMVTPESLANMVSSGKVEADKGTASAPAAGDTTSGKQTAQRPRVERRYEGMDVFHVEMHDPDTDKLMLTLVLNREGWFGWKLKSVRMPALTERYVARVDPDAEPARRRAEMKQKKEAESKAIDDAYRERRAKERAEKIAEFNADPAKILQGLRKLIQSGRLDEACGMAADFDGVVNDDLRKITDAIESKVGVNCSNR
jgi:Protein of unknown function (DUF2939)